MKNGVGHLPVGNDSSAALLSSPPGCVHFGGHSSASIGALVTKLNVGVELWRVCVDYPAPNSSSVLPAAAVKKDHFFVMQIYIIWVSMAQTTPPTPPTACDEQCE